MKLGPQNVLPSRTVPPPAKEFGQGPQRTAPNPSQANGNRPPPNPPVHRDHAQAEQRDDGSRISPSVRKNLADYPAQASNIRRVADSDY